MYDIENNTAKLFTLNDKKIIKFFHIDDSRFGILTESNHITIWNGNNGSVLQMNEIAENIQNISYARYSSINKRFMLDVELELIGIITREGKIVVYKFPSYEVYYTLDISVEYLGYYF